MKTFVTWLWLSAMLLAAFVVAFASTYALIRAVNP